MKKILLVFSSILNLLPGFIRRKARRVSDSAIYKFADGSSFQYAPSWAVQDAKDYLSITGPEQDFFVYVLSSEKADLDPRSLWEKIKPFSYPVLRAQKPPKNKWDQIEQIIYDVPAKESKTALAVALRFKEKTYWLLIEAQNAALSRRGAELMLIVESFLAPGMGEERLDNKKAIVWQKKEKQAFHAFLLEAIEKIKVPGTAIIVIDRNGQVIFSDAFGVKDINTNEPVTLDTPFMIGSTTKALTTLMMARLVDQGALKWETKIKELLKDFKVKDEDLTNLLDIRNSVSASTGMPRRDMEFIFKYRNITAAKRLSELAFMTPTTKMGETFQYSNHLFMAGGYAAARAYAKDKSLEQVYAKAMRELVFNPLGMNRSVIKNEDAMRIHGALPHVQTIDGEIIRLPLENEEAVYSVAPAGGVWSTVEDLAKYIVLELNDGKINGQRLIHRDVLLERRKPQAKINSSMSYGLGLFIEDHKGIKIIGHDGNTLGFSSHLSFFPEHGLGMVILTNTWAANGLFEAVKQKFLELTFKAAIKSPETLDYASQSVRHMLDPLKSRLKTDKESIAWINEWTGTYDNDTLGSFSIKPTFDGFELDCGEWQSALASETEPSGEQNIFLTSPPFLFKLQADAINKRLTLDDGQQKYLFKNITDSRA